MPKQPDEADLREAPKRPFGVYMIVLLLLLGIFESTLEIFRVQSSLVGFWADTEEFLRRHGGLVTLTARFLTDAMAISIANGVIIAVWFAVVVGLWLLQRWAWVSLMILVGVILTYTLVLYFEGAPDYIGMILYVAIAFYMNDHSVQRAFSRRRGAAE